MKLILGTVLCLWSLAVCAFDTGTAANPDPAKTSQSEETTAPGQVPPPPRRSPDTNGPAKASSPDAEFEQQLEMAVQERLAGHYALAAPTLVAVMQSTASPAIQRRAMLELAGVSQDSGQFIKAQQVYAQYIHLFPEDAAVPDVLLRQGLLYRKMGVNVLAEAKFYAVMSSALKLRLDNTPGQTAEMSETNAMNYYKKLVLQAQIEIAETYYQEGKYREASDYYTRILREDTTGADPEELQLKQIRSLSNLTNYTETVASAQGFLDHFSNSVNTAEIRFLLASALKDVGRTHESMRQVLVLLQSQQENIQKDPDTWQYWQRRAGNEIANQFYKDGNYLEALEIYRSLAGLDKSAGWQVPVQYQVGLIYEQLQQWKMATDTYDAIVNRQKDLSATNTPPALSQLFGMAKWRKDYIGWMQKASAQNLALAQIIAPATNTTNEPAPVIK